MDLGIKVHGPTVRSILLSGLLTLSYSSRSVVVPFTAYDVSLQGQYDFSEVFTKDVQSIAYTPLVLTIPQHNTYLRCPEELDNI